MHRPQGGGAPVVPGGYGRAAVHPRADGIIGADEMLHRASCRALRVDRHLAVEVQREGQVRRPAALQGDGQCLGVLAGGRRGDGG